MNEFYAFWQALEPTVQVTMGGVIAGAVLYLVQRYWQRCPLLPLLGKDASTRRKRLAAMGLALMAGAGLGRATGASIGEMVAMAVMTFLSGQTAFLVKEKTTATVPPDSPKV